MKCLLIVIFLLPLMAGAQKMFPTGSAIAHSSASYVYVMPNLHDSVAKYTTMVAAYKRMSGFPKYDSVRDKIVRLHDSAQVKQNYWSALYEDSVYHAKMKF